MGKATRIAELEQQVRLLEEQLKRAKYLAQFIDELCELPEDAVLLHNVSGMRIQCEIGKAARRFRENRPL
jgi:hypothetical protein